MIIIIVITVDGLLHISPIIARLFWIFASLSHKRMDPLINTIFYNMLIKLLSAGRATIVVKLLHAKIVDRTYMKDFASQTRYRDYETAKKELYSLLPWWLMGLSKPWNKLIDSLLDPLQNAPFNKHLAYFLLDHLLINLFPEVTTQQFLSES
jgi:hypothetical protein